jgi:hypothetical protein
LILDRRSIVKGHRYRITLEHLSRPDGAPVAKAPLVFETTNHDDIFAILWRLRGRTDIPADDVESLAVGLKLLSEVTLKNRKAPLFAPLKEALGAFIGQLKNSST